MAFKKLERFKINNDGNLGLGGIPIQNRDIGWIDDNLNDYMQVIAGQYGKSNNWIQVMYNFNELLRIEKTGRQNKKDFFEDLGDELSTKMAVDFTLDIFQMSFVNGLENLQMNFFKDGMDMTILSGFETTLDYANDTINITIGKGALAYKGNIWLNTEDEVFTHNISGDSNIWIHADVKNETISQISRQKKNNQSVDLKEFKTIDFKETTNLPRTFNVPNDPVWNTTQMDQVDVFPLFVLRTNLRSGGFIDVFAGFIAEQLREANIPYLLPHFDNIQQDFD